MRCQLKLDEYWNFVQQHDLQEDNTIVFLPEQNILFVVLIFNDYGIERLYPSQFKFIKI